MYLLGCQSVQPNGYPGDPASAQGAKIKEPRVIAVRCLYDQRPWLNLDDAGDRNPEGIRYRVFLDAGSGAGEHRKGTFHIELFKISRAAGKERKIERTLASAWHYDVSNVHRIKNPGMMGDGYFLHLAWTDPTICGSEVEIVTKFEDRFGRVARSGTRRVRVPKYDP